MVEVSLERPKTKPVKVRYERTKESDGIRKELLIVNALLSHLFPVSRVISLNLKPVLDIYSNM